MYLQFRNFGAIGRSTLSHAIFCYTELVFFFWLCKLSIPFFLAVFVFSSGFPRELVRDIAGGGTGVPAIDDATNDGRRRG